MNTPPPIAKRPLGADEPDEVAFFETPERHLARVERLAVWRNEREERRVAYKAVHPVRYWWHAFWDWDGLGTPPWYWEWPKLTEGK